MTLSLMVVWSHYSRYFFSCLSLSLHCSIQKTTFTGLPGRYNGKGARNLEERAKFIVKGFEFTRQIDEQRNYVSRLKLIFS